MENTFTVEQRVRWLLQQALNSLHELPPDVSQQIKQEFQELCQQTQPAQQRQNNNYGRTKFSQMTNPLPDRTIVRHKVTESDCWLGVWNEQEGVLLCSENGESYEYPSTFCKRHFETTRPDRTPETNGWGVNTCQALLHGEWISLHLLR